MRNVRAVFSKQERAKYISHLDLVRVFSRAFARSHLPVWYTQGFNPHIYMTFALPLQLGIESSVETIDFRLVEDISDEQLITSVNAVLPRDIRILSVGEQTDGMETIAFAEYTLRFASADAGSVAEGYERFLAQPTAVTVKKTKRGEKEIDLKEYFTPLSAELSQGEFTASVRLSAGLDTNVNPSLLLAVMQPCLPPEDSYMLYIRRTAILEKDLTPFR